jgi:dCTP deaminase
MVIGITGTLGAGKGVVVEFLVERGFKHYSVREFLTEEILKRGLGVNRANMVMIENDLREKFGADYVVEELYRRAESEGSDCIIEGVRCLGEIEALRKKDGFTLFAVDADVETRYARIVERGSEINRVSFDEFVAAEQKEMMSNDSNKQNLRKCIEMADYVFKNDWTVAELHGKIGKVLGERDVGLRKGGSQLSEKRGVYSDEGIKDLIKKRIIFSEKEIGDDQIQPSSLDLRLGGKGFCLPFSSLPSDGDFDSFLKNNCSYDIDLNKNGFLHKGCIYILKLQESLDLPEDVGGRINPKSSTGRIDVHVRLITENGEVFDKIPFGYKGDLWVEIYPRSFDIIVHEGDCLNQMRLFDSGTECLSNFELGLLNGKEGLLFEPEGDCCFEKNVGVFDDNVVSMSLELDKDNPGFVARHDAPPVDFSRRDHVFSDYFDRVYLSGKNKDYIIVGQDSFYVLSSKEIIHVPGDFCSEMADIETDSGEVRVHYAGFFDPNWNAQATLEVRNFGQPFLLKDGQKIASFKFYPMKSSPKELYGVSGKGSHYHKQKGPRLAKYFKF